MRTIPDQLKSKNLVPFRKRRGRYNIPGMSTEQDLLIDRVDSDLSSEEQGYVRHYLTYADTFLKTAEENAPEAETQVFTQGNNGNGSHRGVAKNDADKAA